MREIIFRGKDYKGKWVYGSLVEHKIITSNGMISSYNILYQDENDRGSFNEIKQCSVEKETIGQFTGLTDKNGKKIFEGDIVGCFCNTQLFEVEWCDVRGGYFLDDVVFSSCCEPYPECLGNLTDTMEIIGNIWDNPELIKENLK